MNSCGYGKGGLYNPVVHTLTPSRGCVSLDHETQAGHGVGQGHTHPSLRHPHRSVRDHCSLALTRT